MNRHPGSGPTAGRPFRAAVCFSTFSLILLASTTARAVVITGSTYASDTGDPHLPISPQSKAFNIGNPTSASNSIRSDVTYSHAQASASATVTGSGVVKSTSGRAWLDTTPNAPDTSLFNTRGDLWNASASGTQLVANGPAGQNVPFNFFIPGTTLVPAVQFPPNTLPTDPANVMQPRQAGQQGFFSDNGNLNGNPSGLSGVFKEYVQVDANLQIIGQAIPFLTFHGGLIYNPADNTVTGTGDFASPAAAAQKLVVLNGTAPIYNMTLPDISIPADIPTNTPFDALITLQMSMGDPNYTFNGNNPAATLPAGFPSDTSTLPGGVGPIGAGGSFAVEFFITDTTGRFSLQVVPEPSTIALAAIGAVGMLVAIRRRFH
jgi:PEP-CTERM motif